MSQLAEVLTAQKTLEECFIKKMEDLEAQIQSAGPVKDTVAKVADEFRTFRELVFSMLGLLRQQIGECLKQVDILETRNRRKTLIFLGVEEVDKEDSTAVALRIINNQLNLKNITAPSIKVCHRLGSSNNDHQRPILVKFSSVDNKYAVWKAKTALKGSPITVKEFLTKPRQSIFAKARLHFSMPAVWTQDGVIIIKAPDNSRHKITCFDSLNALVLKYPKVQRAVSGSRGEPGGDKQKSRK